MRLEGLFGIDQFFQVFYSSIFFAFEFEKIVAFFKLIFFII